MHPIDHYWRKTGFSPNDAQKEAILHTDGPLFLTAGPGSGKTRVLLWRTLNLIVYHQVDPGEIFLSTFTEKAAKQLQDGLRSLLGMITNDTGRPHDLASMSIGTVHSLCQKLLVDRRFDPSHSRRRSPVLIDELGQYFRIYNRGYWKELLAAGGFDDEEEGQRAINQYMTGRDIYGRHAAVRNCMSLFNRFSEESLDPVDHSPEEELLSSLLKMYDKYRKDLHPSDGAELVDFALLQQRAYDYFRESGAAGSVFRHIIIDEYQDTNAIQEKIFFKLAEGHCNICVVGDDDQSLYRFRGATVENLVQFEERSSTFLGVKPRRIDLSVNYRSRKKIVDFYTDFITRSDWEDQAEPGCYYRIHDKEITAASSDEGAAVATTERKNAREVYTEIAEFVKSLKEAQVIHDYNQVAFLFPAMKGWNGMSTRVHGFIEAFKQLGIPYYAPRAGRFLEVEEAQVTFGLFQAVFGKPLYRDREDASAGYRDFQNWLSGCREKAEPLAKADPALQQFLVDRAGEAEKSADDFRRLEESCRGFNLELNDPAPEELPLRLSSLKVLSLKARKNLTSHNLNTALRKRREEGNPYTVRYLINRVTALDWSVLDLFYQLNGFDYFRPAYAAAERGEDEGPICNLGLITQYLARFMDEYPPILTGQFLSDNRFVNTFFGSFLYALFRLGESEYEDADDPFPKGRVPFLTIHQSKGLEFPVVVLGSLYRTEREAPVVESAIRSLLQKEGEPLDRIDGFDTMRIFYVGLSRAQNLLVLPRYTHNKAASRAFKEILEEERLPLIKGLSISEIPAAKRKFEELGKSYSYTGDYLLYRKCPRHYMIYRKYGFVPSRGQTMFFGRLVHETVEDLHQLVMSEAGR